MFPTGLGKKFVRLNGWKIPRQKWSISYLWEHFLVPEHQIPIWLYRTHQNHWNSCGFIDMLIHQPSLSSRIHWNSCGFIDMLIHGLSMSSRNHWNSLGFINILIHGLSMASRNHWNSLGFINMLILRISMATPKPFKFLWLYSHFEFMKRS